MQIQKHGTKRRALPRALAQAEENGATRSSALKLRADRRGQDSDAVLVPLPLGTQAKKLFREYLSAIPSHHDRMLEMRAGLSIGGENGPFVFGGLDPCGAHIDHGFDRERHAL